MHVLILPSWYFPAGSQEIRGRMFHHHAAEMRKEGIDARIFYAELNLKSPLKKTVSFVAEEGVPTWRANLWFPPKLNSYLIRLWAEQYFRMVMEYIAIEGKPDVIHVQSYLTGMVAEVIKRKTGIPYIITERLSAFITGEISERYKPFIKSAFQQASLVTTVSPGMSKHLQPYTSGPIHVVPNFFNPEIFYCDSSIEKNETFTWVTIGEPAHTKGIDILLKAYSEFRSKNATEKMQLILIDEIPGKNELMKNVQPQFVNEIVWTGLISQHQIADTLRRSHVFISASRVESFGKAIIESLACGLPVIATRTDGASFIIDSTSQDTLIEIGDENAMVTAMTDMYNNYKMYDAEKICNSVSKFSSSNIIREWKEKYAEVAS